MLGNKKNRLLLAPLPIGTMIIVSGDDRITQKDLNFLSEHYKRNNLIKTNEKTRLDKINTNK